MTSATSSTLRTLIAIFALNAGWPQAATFFSSLSNAPFPRTASCYSPIPSIDTHILSADEPEKSFWALVVMVQLKKPME